MQIAALTIGATAGATSAEPDAIIREREETRH